MSDHTEDAEHPPQPEPERPNPLAEDEELQQYGENVRKRIADATRKAAEAERRLQEATHRLGEVGRVAQAAIQENQSLRAGRVDADKAIIDNLVDKSTSDLEVAKQRYREAHDEGDPSKIADALANVSMAAADLRRVQLAKAGYRPQPEERPVQAEPDRQPPRQAPTVAPKAQEWIGRNPWYGQDPERTRVARAADVFVAAMGFDPNTDGYYEEVDRVIQSRLQNANGSAPTRSVAATTPSGRSPAQAQPAANRVALSPSELAQAKRLGVSPEAYATAKRAGGVVLE